MRSSPTPRARRALAQRRLAGHVRHPADASGNRLRLHPHGRARSRVAKAAQVGAFVEKPNRETAESYVASGDYVWNSGMFCFRADALLEVAAKVCPDVLAAARACYASAINHESPIEFAREAFLRAAGYLDRLRDHGARAARRRRAGDVRLERHRLVEGDERSRSRGRCAPAIACAARRSSSRARTATSSPTRAWSRWSASRISSSSTPAMRCWSPIASARSRSSSSSSACARRITTAAAFHKTVHRPWGSFTVLEDAADCKVKRLVVKPGHVLSLQLHHRRSEHWTVVDGTAKVRIGEQRDAAQPQRIGVHPDEHRAPARESDRRATCT